MEVSHPGPTPRAETMPASPTSPIRMATAGCYRRGVTATYNVLQGGNTGRHHPPESAGNPASPGWRPRGPSFGPNRSALRQWQASGSGPVSKLRAQCEISQWVGGRRHQSGARKALGRSAGWLHPRTPRISLGQRSLRDHRHRRRRSPDLRGWLANQSPRAHAQAIPVRRKHLRGTGCARRVVPRSSGRTVYSKN